jgi:NitT/TauT family transport system substrate-binding protein
MNMRTSDRFSRKLLFSLFVFQAAALTATLVASCSGLPPSAKRETLTFGTLAPNEIAGLIYIAQDTQLFANNGLDVAVKDFDTGVTVTDALLRRDIDIGLSAEFPFVAKALAKEDVSIMGTVDQASYFYLFARKDEGIAGIQDLKGRRIGTSRGTITDFYLGRFLELNHMAVKDVVLVDVSPSQIVDALNDGIVDAVVAWSTFAKQIRQQKGSEVTEWQVQSGQASYAVVSARNDWIGSHGDTIHRFLKSLYEASKIVADKPAEAKSIVQREMGYDNASIESAWAEHKFGLTLEQPLILAMEDETRWLISNGLTDAETVPNYLDFIYADGLRSVYPQAVTISGEQK